MKPILFNTEMAKAILEGKKTQTRRPIPKRLLEKYDEYDDWANSVMFEGCTRDYEKSYFEKVLPYQKGDILYVRETWAKIEDFTNHAEFEIDKGLKYLFKCDDNGKEHPIVNVDVKRWRPSIHMPKEAARIFLKVTNVKIERIQDITNEDAIKEGISKLYSHMSKEEFEKWKNALKLKGFNTPDYEYQPWLNYLWHGNEELTRKQIDSWKYQYSAYENPKDSFSSLWQKTYGNWNDNPWVWVTEFERIREVL